MWCGTRCLRGCHKQITATHQLAAGIHSSTFKEKRLMDITYKKVYKKLVVVVS